MMRARLVGKRVKSNTNCLKKTLFTRNGFLQFVDNENTKGNKDHCFSKHIN